MNRYLEKSQTPTVFIFSDVSEGKHKPDDLEHFFDPQVLNSPLVNILQINAATKAKMKSCLKDILKKEGIASHRLPDGYFEELQMQSGGDLRHAIMNVQFRLGANAAAGMARLSAGEKMQEESHRDTKLSTFHALGKLLYAKRVTEKDMKKTPNENEKIYHDCEWNNDRRLPLQFDPERVLEDGDIGIMGGLSFVQFHAPDFFTDITELSTAYDRFSDCAFLMDASYEVRVMH